MLIKVFQIVLGLFVLALLTLITWLCLQLPVIFEFEQACREQGGLPRNGVCLKVETIKVNK